MTSHMDEQNSRMEQILVKDEIREVIMRLARGTDRRDKELIRSCYHPDAIDDHGGFRGSPEGFADWVVEVLQTMKTMHSLGQIRIEVQGNVAYAESYCLAHHIFEGSPDLLPEGVPPGTADWFMGLRYLDRFEKRGGGPWLIANRLCAYEWGYMVSASQKWELGDSYTWGRTDRQDPSYH